MGKGSSNITLKGDRELRRLFNELPKRVVKRGLRQAMNAASTPIAKAARQSAPRESGVLKKAMGKKIKTYTNGNVVAVVGAKRDVSGSYRGQKRVPANYIHLVEQGVRSHLIPQPKRHRILRHPGYSGKTFLQKAYDANVQSAVAIASRKLAQVVESEAAKLGKS